MLICHLEKYFFFHVENFECGRSLLRKSHVKALFL